MSLCLVGHRWNKVPATVATKYLQQFCSTDTEIGGAPFFFENNTVTIIRVVKNDFFFGRVRHKDATAVATANHAFGKKERKKTERGGGKGTGQA